MIFHLTPQELAFLLPALILSLTIHEYAHARVALYFGDHTARLNGRVTLNPLKHLDIFGTLALLFAGFGWAKPVPVNPLYMRNRPLSEILVSLAGPMSNLLLAVLSALALRVIYKFDDGHSLDSVVEVLGWLAAINTVLFVFNLLPIYPLDGHHILREFLPASQRIPYMFWQRKYGMIILLVIVFGPEALGRFTGQAVFDPLEWVIGYAQNVVFRIAGF